MRYIKNTLKKFIIAIIILLILLVPLLSYFSFVGSPSSSRNQDVEIRITNGMNSSKIVDKLYKNGLIRNELFAKIYLKLSGTGSKLKAGTYKLNTNMSPSEIFDLLKNRKIDMNNVNFTIPEGYSIRQIAEKLYKTGLINNVEEFLNTADAGNYDYEFLKDVPENRKQKLEGYLFPDTYEFEKGMTDVYMINEMLKRFDNVYSGLKNEAVKSGISFDKAIIMASIIESEAKTDSERAVIAGVINNRLIKKMKLQIDATVQYALGVHKNVLHLGDLKIDSPYNTYKYTGLPAGPISNPGIKSIQAALNPDKNNYIYYVAKGNGEHYFTSSYTQFLKYKKLMKKAQ